MNILKKKLLDLFHFFHCSLRAINNKNEKRRCECGEKCQKIFLISSEYKKTVIQLNEILISV